MWATCSRYFALSAVLVLQSGCERALDHYCDLRLPMETPEVSAVPFTDQVSQRYDENQLTARAEHSARETTEGLTSARPNARVELNLRALRIPGGMCVRAQYRVILSYAPVTVDLARDLAPGSCKYREILAHELRHVGALRAHLLLAQAALRDALRRGSLGRASRFQSMEEAASTFEEDQNLLLRQAQAALDAVSVDQVAIDTPEEYQRLAHVCESSGGS